MKFGGSVLRNPEGFAQMVHILRAESAPMLVIISAFGSSTRDLEHAARDAESGKQDLAYAYSDAVLNEHRHFADSLLKDTTTKSALNFFLDESSIRIKDLLKGISITRELTNRTLDIILSYGELLAIHIVRHFLDEAGFELTFVSAENIIVTDNVHGAATPNHKLTAHKVVSALLPAFEKKKIVLTQGFVAKSSLGEITTMGKESSNLTATLLAELLSATEVIIWTDVEGICTADPKIVSDSRTIPSMSYAEAHNAAVAGLKLIYSTMIEPAERSNIPITFRSAFHITSNYTTISHQSVHSELPLIALKEHTNLSQITILNCNGLYLFKALQKFPTQSWESTTFSMNIQPTHSQISLPSGAKTEECIRFLHAALLT
ncbi:MAG: hypothetical protein IPM69_01630 [Ignavibacteria bacterium]|nr:hypothetical protein [Ignavibacteria bacterium]